MTTKNKGGRPRVLKGSQTCSFTLDAPSIKAIARKRRELATASGEHVSKSEALREIIRVAK